MEPNRKAWNEQHQRLHEALDDTEKFSEAIDLFLRHHAMVHSGSMVETDFWSFEDEVLADITDEAFRQIPQNEEHSVAWNLFHIARIEDIVANMLIAGESGVLYSGDWLRKTQSTIHHAGNEMTREEIVEFSRAVDIEAVKAYRLAVGQRTREIVQQLESNDLSRKIEASRLQKVLDDGEIVPAASDIVEYWSKRTITGLLMMPFTRHNFLHLNEIARIRKRRK